MNRKLLEDIKLNKFKKRSITNFPHPKEIVADARLPRKYESKSYLRMLVIILSIVSLIGLIYWISNKFQVANINIKAKHQLITLNNKQFTALKNTNALGFEIMIVSNDENRDAVFTDLENVSLKAKGSITLYNEYSARSEKLPIHTFVSDENGKAYLTDNAISIPGYTKVSNKITPGSITVNITAFLAGDSYNGSPNSFIINSFNGTAKYKKIYGKLKTALTGGAQGQVYKTNQSIKYSLNSIANSSFKDNLIKKVIAEVPSGYFLYPDAVKFTFNIDDSVLSKVPNTSVKISGTLTAVLLKEDDLSKILIKSSLPDTSINELKEIRISDISKLSFNFANQNQMINKDTKSILFTLMGDMEMIWQPDISTIKSNLLGIPKESIQSIFKQDPGIDSASIKIFPPWQSYLPNNLSKINIYTQ